MLKGYWQVLLTTHASEISAFVAPDAFLNYRVMAFGIRNAPASFQRLVNTVLNDMPDYEAFSDDIVLYSRTWPAHMCQMHKLFQRLTEANFTLNLAKSEFAKAKITYLGNVVGGVEVRPAEAEVAAILEFPAPADRHSLRRFLGMVGYYRSFCQNFSSIVSPLIDLLIPKVPFV